MKYLQTLACLYGHTPAPGQMMLAFGRVNERHTRCRGCWRTIVSRDGQPWQVTRWG